MVRLKYSLGGCVRVCSEKRVTRCPKTIKIILIYIDNYYQITSSRIPGV